MRVISGNSKAALPFCAIDLGEAARPYWAGLAEAGTISSASCTFDRRGVRTLSADVRPLSETIATIGRRQGLKAAFPEEIAYRKGDIAAAQVEALAPSERRMVMASICCAYLRSDYSNADLAGFCRHIGRLTRDDDSSIGKAVLLDYWA